MTFIKRLSLFLSLLCIILVAAGTSQPEVPEGYDIGDSLEQILSQANNYYQTQDFENSISGYEFLYEKGLRNGHLFYNLGNAYFANGQVGRAILWYERARLYLPRFNDLQVNLNVARSQLVDEEVGTNSSSGTLGLLIWLINQATLREWLWLSVAFLWITTLFGLPLVLFRKENQRARFRIPCWIVGITFILCSSCALYRWIDWVGMTDAILVVPSVEVKSGPGQELSTSFTLHEGTRVQTVQSNDGWVRIELTGNETFTGWVEETAIEPIAFQEP